MQRRVNRSVSFTRNWDGYKDGFGIPDHELWLGNEKLSYMTNQQTFELRIDVIKEEDGAHWNMNYDLFRVDNEDSNYQLELGTYFGNAGLSIFLLACVLLTFSIRSDEHNQLMFCFMQNLFHCSSANTLTTLG